MTYHEFTQYSHTFIETGTAHGEGLKRAIAAGFTDVHSIEADKLLFISASAKNLPAKIHFGLSYDILPTIIPEHRCVFFLDAHPAGPNTYGHDALMRGEREHHQDYIITRELEIILSTRNDHIILIDDMQGWDSARKYRNMIRQTNPLYKFTMVDDGEYKEKILICIPV